MNQGTIALGLAWLPHPADEEKGTQYGEARTLSKTPKALTRKTSRNPGSFQKASPIGSTKWSTGSTLKMKSGAGVRIDEEAEQSVEDEALQ